MLAGAMSCYMIITGYKEGAAQYGGYDCTGAESGLGNPTGCTCHSSGANAGVALTLEFDSAGVPTTHYVGGKSYTIKITGTNNTGGNLPYFGFQLGCIKGSTSQTTPVNAGSFVAAFPTNTHYAAPQSTYYVVGVVEQGTQLSPTSGTGGNGTIYSETINWKAPVSGTGTVSFWSVLNAVNGDGNSSGDSWNVHHIVISEWPTGLGVATIEENPLQLSIFPNPAKDKVNITYNLKQSTELTVNLYGIDGRLISNLENNTVTEGEHTQNLMLPSAIKPGLYLIQLIADGQSTVQRIIVE